MKKIVIITIVLCLLSAGMLSGCIDRGVSSQPPPDGWWASLEEDPEEDSWIWFRNTTNIDADIYMHTKFFEGKNQPPNDQQWYKCVFEWRIGGDYSPLEGICILVPTGDPFPDDYDQYFLDVVSYLPDISMTLSDEDITLTFVPCPTP